MKVTFVKNDTVSTLFIKKVIGKFNLQNTMELDMKIEITNSVQLWSSWLLEQMEDAGLAWMELEAGLGGVTT